MPFVLLLLLAVTPASPLEATLRVAPARTFQTVQGFGASGAWWAQDVGAWPAETRGEILDLLYGPSGAGLTIYRYNVGGAGGSPRNPPPDGIRDPWRRAFSVEARPGVHDFSRDAAALRVLADVRARGVREFVLFANSPPADLTANGRTSGGDDGGPNLPEANEAAFARRFVATCRAIAEKYDLPKVTLSPVNEPDVHWGKGRPTQEGCFYPPRQAARVLAVVAAEMGRAGLPPERFGLDGPEASGWNQRAYFDAVLNLRATDAALQKFLRRLVCHSYGGTDDDRRWVAQRLAAPAMADLPVVMSEWTELRGGRDAGMDSALVLASTVHRDLTLGDAVGWQAWVAASKYDYRDGLIYVDPAARTFAATKRLWALAQWARFVPPGSVRVAAEVEGLEEGDEPVRAGAFRLPGDGGLACVVSNAGGRPVDLRLAGVGAAGRRAFVTDATRDAAPLAVPPDGTVRLPPRGLVTILAAAE